MGGTGVIAYARAGVLPRRVTFGRRNLLNLEDEELGELVKMFDKDGDGSISMNEFKHSCHFAGKQSACASKQLASLLASQNLRLVLRRSQTARRLGGLRTVRHALRTFLFFASAQSFSGALERRSN
jgi:hypothetical protein